MHRKQTLYPTLKIRTRTGGQQVSIPSQSWGCAAEPLPAYSGFTVAGGDSNSPSITHNPWLCPQRLALLHGCHSRTQIAVTCAVRGNLFQHIFGSTCLQMPRVFCVPQLLNRIKCCCSTLPEGKGHVSQKKLVGESWWSLWQPPITRARSVLIRGAHFLYVCWSNRAISNEESKSWLQ